MVILLRALRTTERVMAHRSIADLSSPHCPAARAAPCALPVSVWREASREDRPVR
jgi:hypothetical protein